MVVSYPTSERFPFDEVCGKIFRALAERGWHVPGITVEFIESPALSRRVSCIRGSGFKLRLGRVDDAAGVTEIIIPKKEIHIYHDESGPSFLLYVGSDWEVDQEWWFNESKWDIKRKGEPKRYLRYIGRLHRDQPHLANKGERAPYLGHYNDIGREYDPEGDEPRSLVTAEVMEEFRVFLEEEVLPTILAYPVESKPKTRTTS